MKKFRFLLIFGLIALIVFVSMHANVAKIDTVYITDTAQGEKYVQVSGKIKEFYKLYKGYQYKTEGEKTYITVYSSFGLIGAKVFDIQLPSNTDVKQIYITDGKDSRVIHTMQK